MEILKKDTVQNILLLAFFALLTFVFVLHHEIWADEAQAWLVARDLDFFGLIKHVRTEGHPLLWYFLLMPLTKLFHGFNAVFSMQILSWLLVLAGAFLLVFKSPFNYLAKVSVLLSSGFLYWYSVVPRNYCLIPLFLFLLAIVYKDRKTKPFWYAGLLILLANTHIIMFGFCCVLAFAFGLESFKEKNKKNIAAFEIIFAVLFFMVLYFWGMQNENYIVKTCYPHEYGVSGFLHIYEKVIFNIYGFSNFLVIFLFTLFLVFSGVVFYVYDKKIFFAFLLNFVYQFYIYMSVWMIHPPRAFTLLIVSLFGFWGIYNNIDSKKLKFFINISLIFMFILSFAGTLKLAVQDYFYEFSGGKKAAEYIKQNIPDDAFIISNFPLSTTAVSAYLPKDKWKIFYDGYNNFYTFTLWNKNISHPSVPIDLEKFIKREKVVYAILSTGAFYTDANPVFQSDKNVIRNQERFLIYKFEDKNNDKK